jgi:hypothetical protein
MLLSGVSSAIAQEATACDCGDTIASYVGAKMVPTTTSVLPASIDLWIMAQCPYGVRAFKALIDARSIFPMPVQTRVHFIMSCDSTGTWASMHGPPEVLEAILLTNLMRDRPAAVDAFVNARASTLADSPASPDVALFAAGLLSDKDALGVVDSTIAQILIADARVAADSGYTSSPTLIVNGTSRPVGADVFAYLKIVGRPSTWRWLESNP